MSENTNTEKSTLLEKRNVPVSIIVGWVLTVLLAAIFTMSGVVKILGGEEFKQNVEKMGFTVEVMYQIGVVEIICVVLYLVPVTSTLGAILLTGYMGGAICTHVRMGEPFIAQVIIPMVVWLALCLRNPRVWYLLWPSVSDSPRK